MTTTKTRCINCGFRPADSSTPEGQICLPCYDYAGWENTHSDYAHETLLATEDKDLKVKDFTFKTRKDLLAWVATERKTMEGCPVCHPELAPKMEGEIRQGTSRAGMQLHVTLRADAETKAGEVKSQLPKGWKVETKATRGTFTMTATSKAGDVITLHWSPKGAFRTGTLASGEGKTRKVRNVSEALRLAAA